MGKVQELWDRVYSRDELPWLKNPLPMKLVNKFTSSIKKNGKILDYGCGDGLFFPFFFDVGLQVTASEVSKVALTLVKKKYPNVTAIRCNHPKELSGVFDGIFVWGVIHHIQFNQWEGYLKSFKELLAEDGIILVGGHSMRDKEFSRGYRISPTTGEESCAVDYIEGLLKKVGLEAVDVGHFSFKEAFTGHRRVFKYFFLKKK